MPGSQILIFVYIIIGLGAFGAGLYVGNRAKVMLIDLMSVVNANDSSIDKIGQFDMTEKISGIARIHETVVNSPLQGNDVIAYESKISQTSGLFSSDLYEDEKGEIFRLIKGEDEIMVDPTHAKFHLDKSLVPINLPSVQNIISNKAVGGHTRSVQAKEGVIEDGDPVFIYGKIDNIGDKFNQRTIGGRRGEKFIISNMNKKDMKKYLISYSIVYTLGTLTLFGASLAILIMPFI